MLVWRVFRNPKQGLVDVSTKFEIEHIYVKRCAQDKALARLSDMEVLGNKSILEKRINIRALNYRFADKGKYYLGDERGRAGTSVHKLRQMAEERDDFTGEDIEVRTTRIIDLFVSHLGEVGIISD